MDRGNVDGSINDMPWASVFDPAANARAFSAIQAEGFRAASALVDRFVRIATTGISPNGQPPTSASANGEHGDLFGGADIEPLIRSWWSMVGQFLLGAAPPAADSAAPEPASLDFSAAAAEGRLDLAASAPGVATAEVWLHNRGAADLGQVQLRCSDLLAHDGDVVTSGAVVFDPDAVALPGRSSRGIELRIEVPQGVAPGIYRGTVLAEGHPSLWLPVVLTVRAPLT
ncbi:hypothetical protein [Mycolicibacterium moriokaense]|uniref:Uncharacterized protein n=1 Tax=Mycolicibacterium moriokaense TaxID=39691 RepID=A0A318HD32_9MYCO|nr:hypothetical protein [Mycolicibacterium moriokaense]PXX06309.1 hypothetical protein C8E89_11482 [Mycolicibacterium moriokaense]